MGSGQIRGIVVIDKPGNISSAGVVRLVKKTFNAKKAGHAGTLDPFAEGVLICCLNQATRLAEFLLYAKKKYAAVLKLGEETSTQDLTGIPVSTSKPVDFSPQTIQNIFKNFEGPIRQLPPIYSALKYKGNPLYKLARRGKPIQKPPRCVQIDSITIQEIALPLIRFEVTCSAGTYIRTLCADIGKSLGCGGHLRALKRLESSGFTLDQSVSLSQITKLRCSAELSEHIIPMADALPDMPQFRADTRMAEKIKQGKIMTTRDLLGTDATAETLRAGSVIKIVDGDGDLIAILKHKEFGHRLAYKRVFPK